MIYKLKYQLLLMIEALAEWIRKDLGIGYTESIRSYMGTIKVPPMEILESTLLVKDESWNPIDVLKLAPDQQIELSINTTGGLTPKERMNSAIRSHYHVNMPIVGNFDPKIGWTIREMGYPPKVYPKENGCESEITTIQDTT